MSESNGSPHADLLIVDDDERMCKAVARVLGDVGYGVLNASSGAEAMQVLKAQRIDLLLCDLLLPDADGIALLKAAQAFRPGTEVIVITGHGSIEKAVEAMRLGAYDFIQKPIESASLLKVVSKALEKQQLSNENRQLRRQLKQRSSLGALIGQTPAMQAVRRLIHQVAPTDVSVLIQGESGTGKEIVADAIHALSERAEKPLVKISCAAIPEALLESELFGHERGAFTGAVGLKPGKFELADEGTLLLDEIAEMSPQLQAKLLRVLQDGQFQRLGATRNRSADVRLLAATHADIAERIGQNQFRQDLYYRINTVQVFLPPLRERREDIPLLATHFLKKFSAGMQKEVRVIAPAAMGQLLAHAWPGNVRELEHLIQRAVALSSGDTITGFAFAPTARSRLRSPATEGNESGIVIPIGTTVEEATRQLVEATIERCGGNRMRAARILGIPARSMYRHFGSTGAGRTMPTWQ